MGYSGAFPSEIELRRLHLLILCTPVSLVQGQERADVFSRASREGRLPSAKALL